MLSNKIDTDQLNVYLIEDEKSILKITTEFLENEGIFNIYSFETAEAAKAAIDLAEVSKKSVDLVVLDYFLGVDSSTGEQLFKHLTERRFPYEVIVISGGFVPKDAIQLIFRGASDVLIKPFSLSDFKEKIKKYALIGRDRFEYLHKPWMEIQRSKRDVFFSYCNINKEVALPLVRLLEREGIKVWYAPFELNPGDAWSDRLIKAINDCPVFMVLLTKEAIYSKSVKTEIRRALSRKEKEGETYLFVPVIRGIEEHEIPEEIKKIHWISFSDKDNLVEKLQILRFTIEEFLYLNFNK